ncbi:hypothetical protein ABZ445_16290 [Streptomyces chartreusis]|uniref:hypothetical protein n=1 Tax=Streptomyces chartreusis TaxID=1969 RepID=UPI00340FAAB2
MEDVKITCEGDDRDYFTAERDGRDIGLKSYHDGDFCISAYASPAKFRTFARGILALADEIDGGEVAEAPKPTRAPVVGDKVRILEDDPGNRTGEFVGLIGTLKVEDPNSFGYTPFLVWFGDGSGEHGDRINGTWYVKRVELVDEPEPLADWERDLLDEAPADEPAPARSYRAKYVEEARELLAPFRTPGVEDVIKLAMWLANEDA